MHSCKARETSKAPLDLVRNKSLDAQSNPLDWAVAVATDGELSSNWSVLSDPPWIQTHEKPESMSQFQGLESIRHMMTSRCSTQFENQVGLFSPEVARDLTNHLQSSVYFVYSGAVCHVQKSPKWAKPRMQCCKAVPKEHPEAVSQRRTDGCYPFDIWQNPIFRTGMCIDGD